MRPATVIDEGEIQAIVERVRARMAPAPAPAVDRPPTPVVPGSAPTVATGAEGEGVFASVDAAIAAAERAFQRYAERGLEARRRVIDAIRVAMRADAAELGRLAHEETELGRPEDKRLKNLLVTDRTPGPEDLEPEVWTGDCGMTITEFAPWGVIGSITPTTNPTATIINNTIATLAAGNAIVFNPHPNAKRCSAETVRRLNRAIAAAGGPPNLVAGLLTPTLETARELMHHRGVRLLLVTGGPAVVREALKTDKRAITAGPGNPPVVVDPTADLELAAREIVRGASFDNNVICTDEKETIAVAAVADDLLRAMARAGAVVVSAEQLAKLERLIFEKPGEPGKPGIINKAWIGKNAGRILREIGGSADDAVRLLVAEVPVEHSLVWSEQMMPVMPVVRVASVAAAIDLAVRAEHGFRHTASIFSRDVETITRMARAINCSIFVANAATLAGLGAGGEGFTSYSIATPTGEGLTRPRTFSRLRRLTVAGALRIT